MISTKGRYALRVMIDLAEQPEGNLVPLKEIAMRQGISKKYLEIIMKTLVATGLVAGTSGRNGGYRLTRTPDKYPIGEILEVMEGTLSPVACLARPDYSCERAGECRTLPLWQEFYALATDFFYTKTLEDLLQN